MPVRACVTPDIEGAVTFRGRGQGRVQGRRLVVTVCPHCSQRNDARTAEKGYCQWCAYVPSLSDIEPAEAA